MKITIAIILAAIFLTGCAITNPVKPEQVLANPLGTDSLKTGMTKEQVKSILGEPDTVTPIERSGDILGTHREEWIYQGRYSDLPVKADYFGKTLRLVFDGNNLASYESSK